MLIMSVKSESCKKQDFLKSTTILQSSILALNPATTEAEQQNLSSLIKIGGKSIFGIEKKQPSQSEKRIQLNIKVQTAKTKQEDLNQLFSHVNYIEKPLQKHLMPLEIHGRKRSYKIKLSILKPVCRVLTLVFEGHDFRKSQIQLTEIELQLVAVFISKKTKMDCLADFNMKGLTTAQTRELLTRFSKVLYLLESTKREEENIKFAYKHTLKFLKGQYNQQHQLPFNRKSEMSFYQFFFRDYASIVKKPLRFFFDPLNSKQQLSKKNKTLSTPHLSLVFGCNHFRECFFSYFDERFSKDYMSCVYKKIEKIFLPLEKEINNKNELTIEQVVKRFIEKFKSKQRIKFPWSYKETEYSLTVFKRKIDKIL